MKNKLKTGSLEDISKEIYEWKKLKYYDDKRREEGIQRVGIERPFRLGSILKLAERSKVLIFWTFVPGTQ